MLHLYIAPLLDHIITQFDTQMTSLQAITSTLLWLVSSVWWQEGLRAEIHCKTDLPSETTEQEQVEWKKSKSELSMFTCFSISLNNVTMTGSRYDFTYDTFY